MYIRRHSGRFICIFLFLLISFFYFSYHLIKIQFFRSEYLAKHAERQHNHTVKIEPIRGNIFDRNLRPLALNLTVYSIYANPRQMSQDAKNAAIRDLPRLLDIAPSFVKDRISRDKLFVWIKRKIPFETMNAVKALKIEGVSFLKENKRYYTNNEMAAHILGFAGIDNKGLEGLELQFDHYLRGKDGYARILRDAKQRDLLIDKEFFPAKDGFHLVLTIDETIQFIAEEALDKAFEKHHADSASIIVMNPKTGEVLALANRPTYDLNHFEKSDVASRTNRAIAHVYEPGSVFKIVAASAALEEDLFAEKDVIFCENGEYRQANRILHDVHKYGDLTFKEVIQQSSNIGTVKIVEKMGADTFYRYADRFRFGKATGIDLKGEVNGWLKPPSKWSKTSIGALPIGQEITVTPLQLVCAVSAIANGGLYMKPFVVKYITDSHNELIQEFQPEVVDRVISPSTAERVQLILESVVDHGTGRRAQVDGVRVGGKTGTAQKVVDGRYSPNQYYASFIGFAPVDDPQIAAVVVFDHPHPNYYGGTVAAPVFREMLVDSLKYLEASRNNF